MYMVNVMNSEDTFFCDAVTRSTKLKMPNSVEKSKNSKRMSKSQIKVYKMNFMVKMFYCLHNCLGSEFAILHN
jgi:hypothetical protein